MKINFKCDVCEHAVIEEVLTEVTQYSIVSDLEELPDGSVAIDYGDTNTEFGEVSHYQCLNCGKTLTDHGSPISTPEDLYESLKANEMLEEIK